MDIKITVEIEGYREITFEKWLPRHPEEYPRFEIAINHVGDLVAAFLDEHGTREFWPFDYVP
ncbi:MAG: hypothetical protein HY231_22485 [Acidobacteria bacterium]|nr:hypothetical protein [Acidobacteriota bacterium]